MKKYFKHFCIPFIITGIIIIICATVFFLNRPKRMTENPDYQKNDNVFDYADKLDQVHEDILSERIKELEKEYYVDLAVVILNENLTDYVRQKGQYVAISQQTMVFADDFMDSLAMGYDKPHGDAILFLDNWSREADGNLYYYVSTTGRCVSKPSPSDCSELADRHLGELRDDSDSELILNVYSGLITDLAKASGRTAPFNAWIPVAVGLIASVIYYFVNRKSRLGKVTVNDVTYVDAGQVHFTEHSDIFINRTITKTPRPKQTGGGGGGRSSSGGISHGGGGGHR